MIMTLQELEDAHREAWLSIDREQSVEKAEKCRHCGRPYPAGNKTCMNCGAVSAAGCTASSVTKEELDSGYYTAIRGY